MQNAGARPGQIYSIRGFADQELRLPDKPNDPSNRRISIIVLNLPKKSDAPAAANSPKPGK
jgi:chemotaxis protein MotB